MKYKEQKLKNKIGYVVTDYNLCRNCKFSQCINGAYSWIYWCKLHNFSIKTEAVCNNYERWKPE